ncbi:MAG: SBBP repeat-containing protein [Deltaproteobacteria bacterium]|nr:SBBP repeat-containing protein [Deltaproteobacteria bacterium]
MKISITTLLFASIIAGCSFDASGPTNSTESYCGNGLVEENEDCDNENLNNSTCEDFGYQGGTLSCAENCRFDFNICEGEIDTCGDGHLDEGEECDTDQFAQSSCETLGLGSGTLKCTDLCRIDTSLCTNQQQFCGDGVITGDEECDLQNLGGASCLTSGFYSGSISCNSDCTLNTENCEGRCGDSIIQEGFEDCEGSDLNDMDCGLLGYYGGLLVCNSDCTFNLSSCEASGKCGDGIIQETMEECDTDTFGEDNCGTLGYYGGNIQCSDECTIDISDCELNGYCGDSIIQGVEECDGTNLNGSSCTILGYYDGELSCLGDCVMNLSDCESYGRCGDSIIQSEQGEICDGTNLTGHTCEDSGYYGGTAVCTDCTVVDESDCINYGKCGDSIVQNNFGEVCDLENLNTSTCRSRGYFGGNLSCDSLCTSFVESGCEEMLIETSSVPHFARDIVSDDSGNLFITGTTAVPGRTETDVFISAFDIDGNQFFTTSFGSLLTEYSYSIALDSSGNIFVTGYTDGDIDTEGGSSHGDSDIFVAKYSPEGTQLWIRQFGTIGGDSGRGIKVDSMDNVVVSGWIYEGANNSVYVMKLDNDGNMIWNMDFGTTSSDYSLGVTLDDSDTIYIVGSTYGDLDGENNTGGRDPFVTKISPAGNRIWTRIVDLRATSTGSTNDDEGYTVKVNPSNGNIYVSGWMEFGMLPPFQKNYFIASLTPDGGEISHTAYFPNSADDVIYSMDISDSGEIFLTGFSAGTLPDTTAYGTNDIIICKYNDDLELQWIKRYGGSAADNGFGITVTPHQTVCIAGNTNSDDGVLPGNSTNNPVIICTSPE